jgi:hypothetical protein
MAQKYLGDVSSWFELATVNNLQPPYVDEVGTKFNLLAPGSNNNVLISAERARDVHVGTKVSIGSYKVREQFRAVERLIVNSDNTMVLFLSGDSDMSQFKTTEGAFVRVFATHTVSTGSFISIPLTSESGTQTRNTPQSDALRRIDRALYDFGVDVARDSKDDIVIDANGNFKMAYGLRNVRQAVMGALRTVRGELPFHQDYGIDVDIGGQFVGDVDAMTVVAEAIRSSVLSDSRYVDCRVISINGTPSSMAINMTVTIAGSSQVIPLSFVV